MGWIRTVQNQKLSLFQSAIDDWILSRRANSGEASETEGRPHLGHPMVLAATVLSELLHGGKPVPQEPPPEVSNNLGASGGGVWSAARLLGELFLAKLHGNTDRVKHLEDDLKGSSVDPGFLECFEKYLAYFGPDGKLKDVPYIRHTRDDDFVLETLPPNATVALIGDWATGTEDAERLLRQVARQKPDMIFHLGDVYYSGTEREVGDHVLEVCNQVLGKDQGRIALYNLSGNHDMYSGGVPYYDLIKKLNPSPLSKPEQAQPASYFSVRNKAWQFLSMDTGLHDRDPFEVADAVTYLEPDEAEWHLDKINRFYDYGGRTILLSHHQLFSAFSAIGKAGQKPPGQEAFNPKLLVTFGDVLQQDKVAAWFWGHEHNLCIYEPYPPLNKGRCAGHSAIPVFTSPDPYAILPAVPNPPRLVSDAQTGAPVKLGVDPHGVYYHGYVLIRLNDANKTADVFYYQENDEENPIYYEQLP